MNRSCIYPLFYPKNVSLWKLAASGGFIETEWNSRRHPNNPPKIKVSAVVPRKSIKMGH